MDDRGAGKMTPLMRAARLGDVKMISLLLQCGADVNAKSRNGFTVLMHAASNGRGEAVSALLQAGAKVDATDEDGWTALTHRWRRVALEGTARWSGETRNWTPIGAVTLNPERDSIVKTHSSYTNK